MTGHLAAQVPGCVQRNVGPNAELIGDIQHLRISKHLLQGDRQDAAFDQNYGGVREVLPHAEQSRSPIETLVQVLDLARAVEADGEIADHRLDVNAHCVEGCLRVPLREEEKTCAGREKQSLRTHRTAAHAGPRTHRPRKRT